VHRLSRRDGCTGDARQDADLYNVLSAVRLRKRTVSDRGAERRRRNGFDVCSSQQHVSVVRRRTAGQLLSRSNSSTSARHSLITLFTHVTFLRAGLSISGIPCLTRSALVPRLVSANPLKTLICQHICGVTDHDNRPSLLS